MPLRLDLTNMSALFMLVSTALLATCDLGQAVSIPLPAAEIGLVSPADLLVRWRILRC